MACGLRQGKLPGGGEAAAAELAAFGSVKLAVKGAAVGARSPGDEAVSGAAG